MPRGIKNNLMTEEQKIAQRVYNNKHIEKCIDNMRKSIICDDCKRKYTFYNKSRHMKSKPHLKYLELIAMQKNNDIKNILI